MLVLSRKMGERIHIGDDIIIEVRRVAGNRVSLALEAPADVRILRGELQAFDDGFCREQSDPPVRNQHANRLEVRLNGSGTR